MKFHFAHGMVQMMLASGSSVGILWTWPGEELSEEPDLKRLENAMKEVCGKT